MGGNLLLHAALPHACLHALQGKDMSPGLPGYIPGKVGLLLSAAAGLLPAA